MNSYTEIALNGFYVLDEAEREEEIVRRTRETSIFIIFLSLSKLKNAIPFCVDLHFSLWPTYTLIRIYLLVHNLT